MCDSMPQTIACERPSRSKPSASTAEKQVLATGSTPLQVLGHFRDGIAQALGVLLRHPHGHAERVRALDQPADVGGDVLERLHRRAEALL